MFIRQIKQTYQCSLSKVVSWNIVKKMNSNNLAEEQEATKANLQQAIQAEMDACKSSLSNIIFLRSSKTKRIIISIVSVAGYFKKQVQ